MATAEHPLPREGRAGIRTGGFRHPAFPLAVFHAFWFGQFFLALLPSWSGGSYYDYGFLTPLVLPWIYLARWKEQELDPDRWRAGRSRIESSKLTWILLATALVLIAFLRLVESVDSAWRAPLYAHGGVVLAFAGYLHIRLFGWSRWTAYVPVAVLVILSIPLPVFVETSLIHGLTREVTETAAMATRWMGVPVTVSGETLLLDNIPLQVGEGCSGVRSFQSSVFAGFLLGELLRLRPGSRLLLVVAGVAAAFLANCLRVIFLVRHAADHGEENLQSLHDVSGGVSMTATFAFLFLAALLLNRDRAGNSRRAAIRTDRTGQA